MKTRTTIIVLILLGAGLLSADESQARPSQGIQAAAVRSDADAEFELARAYLHGKGVPREVRKSLELMRSAAARGHADAIGGIGYYYRNGVAVERNDAEAASWFRKGAERGSAKAQLNLAKMLLAGQDQPAADDASARSMEEMREDGLRWMKTAADRELAEASLAYGAILYFGRILNPLSDHQDTRIEALGWLIMASERGEITATKTLEDTLPGLKDGELDAARKKTGELRKLVRRKQP